MKDFVVLGDRQYTASNVLSVKKSRRADGCDLWTTHGQSLYVVNVGVGASGDVWSTVQRCAGRLFVGGDALFLCRDSNGLDLHVAGSSGCRFVVVAAHTEKHALSHSCARRLVEKVRREYQSTCCQERKGIPASLRFRVLSRDGFQCRYCGASRADGAVLHVDHIVPVSRGGSDDESNLCASCAACNLGKSNRFDDHPPAACG